ncbi:MAG TPA: prephenate dehydrogenase/arogenate dehydrogenase family protein [Nitrososphaerales archaeon]|nr:prephenate dehydrogenase/arogenate dehydrogenase family protein [Nitrososphaerales archaeon]
MKVAVLGASGGMGSFFARYFLERGDTVRGSDLGKGSKNSQKGDVGSLSSHKTNSEAVKGCDVTVIAVPMDSTLKVAKEVASKLKSGSTLVEISSVKGETLPALRKAAGKRVALLSIHPLFGPALGSTKGMKIAVIVGKEGGADGQETSLARRLFPEARIIPMSRKEHDRTMAVVLSLTHLLNVVYAGTVSQFLSPDEFMKVSTPNSSMQLTLAEAVLAQDARLSYAIQAWNPYSKKVARAASRELKRVLAMVESSDWEAFDEHFSRLSKRYKSDRRGDAVIREIYSAAEKAG